MRRLCLAALLFTGCANTNGPFAARSPQRVDDPRYNISEQEARSRDRLALPEQLYDVLPRSVQPRNRAEQIAPSGMN